MVSKFEEIESILGSRVSHLHGKRAKLNRNTFDVENLE